MKTNYIILLIASLEIIVAIIFIFLIRKTNKKLKQLECIHKNKFHFVDGEKQEITCLDCGKRLKNKKLKN